MHYELYKCSALSFANQSLQFGLPSAAGMQFP